MVLTLVRLKLCLENKRNPTKLTLSILLVVCFVLLIYIILFYFWSRVPCIPPSLLSWGWLWTPGTRACPYLPSAGIAGEHCYCCILSILSLSLLLLPVLPPPLCFTTAHLLLFRVITQYEIWIREPSIGIVAFKLSKASCFSAMMVGYYPSIGVFMKMKLGRESLAHTCILVYFLWQSWAYPSLSSAYFGVSPNFIVVIQDFSSVRVLFLFLFFFF